MSCLLGCIALAFPRLVLFLVFLFSSYLGRAYETTIWPLLGFFVMPTTTLAYAFAINSKGSVQGIHLFIVILAALIDLGINSGSARGTRKRDD